MNATITRTDALQALTRVHPAFASDVLTNLEDAYLKGGDTKLRALGGLKVIEEGGHFTYDEVSVIVTYLVDLKNGGASHDAEAEAIERVRQAKMHNLAMDKRDILNAIEKRLDACTMDDETRNVLGILLTGHVASAKTVFGDDIVEIFAADLANRGIKL